MTDRGWDDNLSLEDFLIGTVLPKAYKREDIGMIINCQNLINGQVDINDYCYKDEFCAAGCRPDCGKCWTFYV